MIRIYLWSLVSALALGLAFLYPGNQQSAFLGWVATLSLLYVVRISNCAYRPLYFIGLVVQPIGFYWLFETIASFGGFDQIATLAIFSLFVTISALQFVVFAFLFRNLETLDRFGVRAAVAWTLGEFISVRIFPWQFAHSQVGFSPIIQIAELAGSLSVTFLMFWVAEQALSLLALPRRSQLIKAGVSFLALIASTIYGSNRISQIEHSEGRTLSIAVVQANITVNDKHNISFFEKNTQRYIELTRELKDSPDLVIWPESVVMEWINDKVGNIAADPRLPTPNAGSALLVGSLTFNQIPGVTEQSPQLFNSALAIYKDGTVPQPYHKRILMPFGEFVPFSRYLPWLKDLAHLQGEFNAGTEASVFSYETKVPGSSALVSPLICYEDLVPALSYESVEQGAQLLVNITNDAWFGDTAAPYQHHVLATFRAIETRRYLVRSTNSGLTAIVAPTGKTTSHLAPFSEGVMSTEVKLLTQMTLASQLQDKPWIALLILATCLILYKKFIKGGSNGSH